MFIIRLSRRTILIPSCWDTIGSGSRGIRIAGVLVGILWAVRYLIIGMFLAFPGWCYSNKTFRFDPSGFIVEHYIDGDLLDETQPTNRSLASPSNLHVWGKLSFL